MESREVYGQQHIVPGNSGAGAYARVGLESGVMSADPHQLIVLLFDGAESCIRNARIHVEMGAIAERGRSISRAVDIINQGLLAALDMERGGEISANLARIYDYIIRLLLEANVRVDVTLLDQAEHLLQEISSAWRELAVTLRKE
ncbi:flagellar export chaperone FliS [Halioglobus japonicus]|uniref:Flagellar secretion chaperone FliS n=1 Tax=Halioglobus japonicus TaxID=930805 RepID=A0AAP8ME27_9GAMM|nr:flagellar export chaperone FliS [Halioglobus japonicus]AQA18104.1 flagellar export chaperone FliS [Halioglobus japonicus]PLW86097.1 flagellar export chaperone FliS [Halioglobus japonicus]GHD14489.1 flagellar protein FliS [Halioglobus japonicus]